MNLGSISTNNQPAKGINMKNEMRLIRNEFGGYATRDGRFFAVRDEAAKAAGITCWSVGRDGEFVTDVATLREARAVICELGGAA